MSPNASAPSACGNEMLLQLPPSDPLLACVLRGYSAHFTAEGRARGPCAALEGYEHASIAALRRLHTKPGLKAKKSERDSWYLGKGHYYICGLYPLPNVMPCRVRRRGRGVRGQVCGGAGVPPSALPVLPC